MSFSFGQSFFFNSHRVYEDRFRCLPIIRSGKVDLEYGDKIILPHSALSILSELEVQYPMMFNLSNTRTRQSIHCGVIEFSANEGNCYVPEWIMQYLGLTSDDFISVRNVNLPKGSFVKFRPQTSDFLSLSNPKAFLETQLSKFSCLTKGSTISIHHPALNRFYLIDVLELKPADACCIVETDLNVEFAAPLDYKEPERTRTSQSSMKEGEMNEKEDDDVGRQSRNSDTTGSVAADAPPTPNQKSKIVPFQGTGYRLSDSSSSAASMASGSNLLSSGGRVVSQSPGTPGSTSRPRTLNKFEQQKREKAFQGAGNVLG